MEKKRCEFCQKWCMPSPYAGHHQKCCSNIECKKKRKEQVNKNWREKNPSYEKSRSEKKRIWAGSYPNYWQRYRKEHPDYVRRDNKRRCSSRKKQCLSARQDTARQIALEKLESIRNFKPNSAARQDAVFALINGILDYLFWREGSARQDKIALAPSPG